MISFGFARIQQRALLAAPINPHPFFRGRARAHPPSPTHLLSHPLSPIPRTTMSTAMAADSSREVPVGFRFHPKDNELVKFYLLPCARGEPAPFPGVIIEDDTAGSTPPRELFRRHRRCVDEGAYFYVRTGKEKPGFRQDRSCGGGGTWKGQKGIPHKLRVAGGGSESIEWSKYNLSLRVDGASTGWVMHEYAVTKPPCRAFRICHISFTGHGHKRKREPDDDDWEGGSSPQRERVGPADDNGSAASGFGTTMIDQDTGAAVAHASADHQLAQFVLTDEDIALFGGFLARTDFLTDEDLEFEEEELASTEQQVEHVQMPQLIIQESGTAEQLYAGVEEEQKFWDSFGIDFQSICAVPGIGDMATRTLDGGAAWGGFTFC